MPAIARDGDPCTTGHDCDATSTVTAPSGAAAKVFIDGKPACCVGDPVAPHTIKVGKNCVPHDAVVNAGSPTITVGGKAVARVGDSVDGGVITGGAGTVSCN